MNGARSRWPSGNLAGAPVGGLGMAGRVWAPQGPGLADLHPDVHMGGHGSWHPQHSPQVSGASSRALLEPWRAPRGLSSALGTQGQARLHSLLHAAESHASRTHSRVPGLQTTPGMIRTGGRWKQGRRSRLVRLRYHFGTDKSDHTSQGLATTQANSPQWDIFQAPL